MSKMFCGLPTPDEQTGYSCCPDQLLKHIITPVCHACGFENWNV